MADFCKQCALDLFRMYPVRTCKYYSVVESMTRMLAEFGTVKAIRMLIVIFGAVAAMVLQPLPIVSEACAIESLAEGQDVIASEAVPINNFPKNEETGPIRSGLGGGLARIVFNWWPYLVGTHDSPEGPFKSRPAMVGGDRGFDADFVFPPLALHHRDMVSAILESDLMMPGWHRFRPEKIEKEPYRHLSRAGTSHGSIGSLLIGAKSTPDQEYTHTGAFGYDLEGAYQDKRAFNKIREDHKHEARKIAGGKQF